MLKKSLVALAASSALISGSAMAIDFKAGIEAYSAEIQVNGYDAEDKETLVRGFLAVEHSYAMVPNARIEYGEHSLGIDRGDLTLYYGVVDNSTLSLDLGLGLTIFDFGSGVDDEKAAHLYSAVDFPLPVPGLSLFGSGRYALNSNTDGYDVSAGVRWSMEPNRYRPGYGINVGYRFQEHTFDDLWGWEYVIENDGPFLAVDISF